MSMFMPGALLLFQVTVYGPGGAGGTFSSPVLFPDGTAGAPSIGWASDADGTGTGFFRNAADQIAVSLGGGHRMTFVSTSMRLGSAVNLEWTSTAAPTSSGDAILGREAAATLQLGADLNGAAIAQRLKGPDGITGSDTTGGALSLGGQIGTGAGVTGATSILRTVTKATGTTAQTTAPAIIVCPTKILSNTSATAQTIATLTTTTTTGGVVTVDYASTACSGTTCDADGGLVKVAWNNNAGTVAATMTAVAIQADSDATGTLATTPTATVATNVVSVKFTPTWVTIVPTLVTGFATFTVSSDAVTVACQ